MTGRQAGFGAQAVEEAYGYDGRNRLNGYWSGQGGAEYRYGLDGLRKSKVVDGERTRYVYDGGDIIGEVKGAAGYKYYRGTELLGYETGGERYYYQTNGHGDVTAVLDAAGQAIKDYRYNAYGEEEAVKINPMGDRTILYHWEQETEGVHNPFRYCGEYWDAETNLTYLRNRYYDPSIGRFISEDPHWNTGNMIYGDNPDAENPAPDSSAIMQSGNLYGYCRNNPINRIDPTGTYDRDKAVEYASLFWSEVVWRMEGGLYFDGRNCATFVSYCLSAGKLNQTDDWYMNFAVQVGRKVTGSYSLSWTVASEQYRIFSNPDYGFSVGKEIIWTKNGIADAANNKGIQVGDLMYFCGPDGMNVHHSTIITKIEDGKIYYTAHSGHKYNYKLSDVKNWEVVVIVKIRDDA